MVILRYCLFFFRFCDKGVWCNTLIFEFSWSKSPTCLSQPSVWNTIITSFSCQFSRWISKFETPLNWSLTFLHTREKIVDSFNFLGHTFQRSDGPSKSRAIHIHIIQNQNKNTKDFHIYTFVACPFIKLWSNDDHSIHPLRSCLYFDILHAVNDFNVSYSARLLILPLVLRLTHCTYCIANYFRVSPLYLSEYLPIGGVDLKILNTRLIHCR